MQGMEHHEASNAFGVLLEVSPKVRRLFNSSKELGGAVVCYKECDLTRNSHALWVKGVGGFYSPSFYTSAPRERILRVGPMTGKDAYYTALRYGMPQAFALMREKVGELEAVCEKKGLPEPPIIRLWRIEELRDPVVVAETEYGGLVITPNGFGDYGYGAAPTDPWLIFRALLRLRYSAAEALDIVTNGDTEKKISLLARMAAT